MKQHFHTLYRYNQWCNEQMIGLIAKNPNAYSERAKTLIGHTLNAHHIWICRLQKIEPRHGVWDIFEIDELLAYSQENFEASLYVLERFDFEYILKYVNSKNETHNNRVKEILFQIVNHSTYHRGQLMSELKTQGVSPIDLDFVYFKEV